MTDLSAKPRSERPIGASGYRVVRADLEKDREEILAVWNRNLPAHTPSDHESRFGWYYWKNPCGPGWCWLLLSPDDCVVGTAGLGLRRLRVGGKSLMAGIASDLAVDREHRFLQPALMLQRTVLDFLEDGLSLIYGLPNRHALPVFRRLGYRTVGTAQRWAKVLRVQPYLERLRGPAKSGMALAGLVNAAMRAASTETWQPAGRTVLKELTTFDSRFDALWERAAARYGAVGERTAEFLRWRFQECALRQYVLLGLLDRTDERLLGYAVYHTVDSRPRVVDLWADPEGGALEALLGRLLRWFRARDAVSVSIGFLGDECLERALRRFGFVCRGEAQTLTVFARADAGLPPEGGALPGWYLLEGDEDYN